MAFIQYLTQIHLDCGVIQRLPEELDRLGIVNPLLVTDAGVRAAGLVQRAQEALGSRPAIVFDATPANPTEAAVQAACALAQGNRCDGVIALGGGSSIDLAKGVALAATHPGPLRHYATIEGGSDRISDRVLPVVAIPTTAGTGSEVARGAILIVADGRKLGFHSWHLLPRVALLDPELTLSLPSGLTAATGMDAIAHCMETAMSAAVNPPADAIALDGLSRGWRHIERATRDGSDREARWQMMSASMQGAMAFQKGLGCVHSLSHSLGAVLPRLHHGTLNAIFLPAVIRFNASAQSVVRSACLQRMSQAMGLGDGDAHGHHLADAITQMNQQLGLPTRLKALDVDPALFDRVISGALADHCHKTNPRLASAQDYNDMLLASW